MNWFIGGEPIPSRHESSVDAIPSVKINLDTSLDKRFMESAYSRSASLNNCVEILLKSPTVKKENKQMGWL